MPIATAREYEAALFRIVVLALRNPRSGSAEARELEQLSRDVRAYDEVRHPFHECDAAREVFTAAETTATDAGGRSH